MQDKEIVDYMRKPARQQPDDTEGEEPAPPPPPPPPVHRPATWVLQLVHERLARQAQTSTAADRPRASSELLPINCCAWGPPVPPRAPITISGIPELHRSHVPWRVGTSLTFCGLCGSYSLSRRSPALAA
eukprot:6214117-Heterocapsa_arctica.AAC.1